MTGTKFSVYIHYSSITLAPCPICLIMLALKFLLRFQNDLDCVGSLRKRWNYRWHGSKTFLQQTLLDTTVLLDATSNDLLGGRYFCKKQLHPMHLTQLSPLYWSVLTWPGHSCTFPLVFGHDFRNSSSLRCIYLLSRVPRSIMGSP